MAFWYLKTLQLSCCGVFICVLLCSLYADGLLMEAKLDICPPHLNRGGHLVVHGNRCYEVVTYSPVTWEDAKQHCSSNHGRMAEIEDSSTQSFLASYLSSLDDAGSGVWIGLQDKDNEGTWIWDSGSHSQFRHWASGSPGGFFGFVDDCAVMKLDGYWYDYPCNTFFEHFAYICQHDILPTA